MTTAPDPPRLLQIDGVPVRAWAEVPPSPEVLDRTPWKPGAHPHPGPSGPVASGRVPARSEATTMPRSVELEIYERLLIRDITVVKGAEPKLLHLQIRWQGGATETIDVRRQPNRAEATRYPRAIARSAEVALQQYYLTKCSGMAPIVPTRRQESIVQHRRVSGPARASSQCNYCVAGRSSPSRDGAPDRPALAGGL